MKIKIHFIFSLCFVFLCQNSFSQLVPTKFWVQFTDKNNNPFSISSPLEYLTQRAIDRREAQSIAVTVEDLPVNPDYLNTLRSKGAVILNPSKWLNGTTIFLSDSTLLDSITSLPFVKNVDAVMRLSNSTGNNFIASKLNEELISLGNSGIHTQPYKYGSAYNQVKMLNGDFLHNFGYRGEGKIIAVLDAGFLNTNTITVFDSLRMNGKILGTKDFVSETNEVYSSHGHGTMVLSTMAANQPDVMTGTAPEASYFLLRSEDGASETIVEEYNWVSAAEFADSAGADIISSSLGYSVFDSQYSFQNHSYFDMNGSTTPVTIGADKAFSKGMLVVNSAGNEGNKPWHFIIAPADGKKVLAIGAVDSFGEYADFSSGGPSSDGRIKPNVSAQGKEAIIASPYGGVFAGNGTSFSCPVISGMAACLWQASPNSTNAEIKNAIEQSADKSAFPDHKTGYGIPDFAKAFYLLRDHNSFNFLTDKIFNIFGNPFHDSFSFTFYSRDEQDVLISLFDVLGRKIYQNKISLSMDSFNVMEIPDSKFSGTIPPGIVFLKLSSNGGNYIVKLLKL